MTNLGTSIQIEHLSSVPSRSLWQDSWLRLRKNKAAVTSVIVLIILTLAGILGPILSPHPYDKIYPQFVRQAPSFTAYPQEDKILPGLEQLMARVRLKAIDTPQIIGGGVIVKFTALRPTDERILRYFQRSDLFNNPILELSADRLSGTLRLNITRNFFFLGTDN